MSEPHQLPLDWNDLGAGYPMGKINRMFGINDVKRGGQIRMDTDTKQLVLLLRFILVDGVVNSEYTEYAEWHVRNILTGRRYRLPQTELGEKVYNEMEALAWAAR